MTSLCTASAPRRPAPLLAALASSLLMASLAVPPTLAAQEVSPASAPYATAEGLVRHLYDLVTFPAGSTVDLDALRETFLAEAVIVLRTSRTASTVMTVDDFLEDWRRFLAEADVGTTGFVEEITALEVLVFGDIAHVLVLYEASIPGRMEPREGVDSFHLVQRGGRWWITGVLNELPAPGRPVPEVLRGG